MLRKTLSVALASICLWGFGLNTLSTEASTVAYTDRKAAAASRKLHREQQVQQTPTVNVGYIITGDDAVLLDNETMGYIRRMLNAKFPGDRYPAKRMDGGEGSYEDGRKNTSDRYILTEAHDVLMQEYEILESINSGTVKHITTTIEDGREKRNSTRPRKTTAITMDTTLYPSGKVSLHDQLSQLTKEDYVRMARKANADGAKYDYLIMLNIYSINEQYRKKFFGITQLQDFCISVKAIDVQSGEYIARREYLQRNRTTAGPYASISNRRSMRRAIISGMIECFDDLPIGKYSVCDNRYCKRRQDELRTEATFDTINRHCVKHCHDNTGCLDHMVDYAKDADLPASYVNHRHKVD